LFGSIEVIAVAVNSTSLSSSAGIIQKRWQAPFELGDKDDLNKRINLLRYLPSILSTIGKFSKLSIINNQLSML